MECSPHCAPLVLHDAEWHIENICIRPVDNLFNGVRCEIEVLEWRRGWSRFFVLEYHAEFFEVWDIAPDDCGKIALHARRWIGEYLKGNGHRLDASRGQWDVQVEIRF